MGGGGEGARAVRASDRPRLLKATESATLFNWPRRLDERGYEDGGQRLERAVRVRQGTYLTGSGGHAVPPAESAPWRVVPPRSRFAHELLDSSRATSSLRSTDRRRYSARRTRDRSTGLRLTSILRSI